VLVNGNKDISRIKKHKTIKKTLNMALAKAMEKVKAMGKAKILQMKKQRIRGKVMEKTMNMEIMKMVQKGHLTLTNIQLHKH